MERATLRGARQEQEEAVLRVPAVVHAGQAGGQPTEGVLEAGVRE